MKTSGHRRAGLGARRRESRGDIDDVTSANFLRAAPAPGWRGGSGCDGRRATLGEAERLHGRLGQIVDQDWRRAMRAKAWSRSARLGDIEPERLAPVIFRARHRDRVARAQRADHDEVVRALGGEARIVGEGRDDAQIEVRAGRPPGSGTRPPSAGRNRRAKSRPAVAVGRPVRRRRAASPSPSRGWAPSWRARRNRSSISPGSRPAVSARVAAVAASSSSGVLSVSTPRSSSDATQPARASACHRRPARKVRESPRGARGARRTSR